MNRRHFFGLLAAIPLAGALAAAGLKVREYIPRMREMGGWSIFGNEQNYLGETFFVRHDIVFIDQHGKYHQWGVGHSFDEEPTPARLEEVRILTRDWFVEYQRTAKAYPVGPSAKFALPLPRGLRLARYV